MDWNWVPEYQAWCTRRYGASDCRDLLGDAEIHGADAKRNLAISFAVDSAWEGMEDEVKISFNSARLKTAVIASLAVYMALLVAPEPITKIIATSLTVMLWAYLGMELWSVINGYLLLIDEVDDATSFTEIREAGEHFGRSIGKGTARILVMLVTAALGSTGNLATKMSALPGIARATEFAGVRGTSALLSCAAGKIRHVTVTEGRLDVVMASGQAVSMSASGTTVVPSASNSVQAVGNAPRAFKSFRAFKRAMGGAGRDKAWHHIVEKNQTQFAPEQLHNTDNIVLMDKKLHNKISGFYSSRNRFVTGSNLTIREWLRHQSFEQQREFGLLVIENVKKGIW